MSENKFLKVVSENIGYVEDNEILPENISLTENGAYTNSSSLNKCLDLFFFIGSVRRFPEESISKFVEAYKENKRMAIDILLYSRDVRNGQGERRFFIECVKHLFLKKKKLSTFKKFNTSVLEWTEGYGRIKDYYEIVENLLLNRNLESEYEKVLIHSVNVLISGDNGLAYKWFPRKGYLHERVRRYRKLSRKEMRSYIVSKSDTVEKRITLKQDIDFSKIPSLAFKYNMSVFFKYYKEKIEKYIQDLSIKKEGVKVNVGNLYPYDIISSIKNLRSVDDKTYSFYKSQWETYPKPDIDLPLLCMVDCSGSMDSAVSSGSRITMKDVAISMGLLIAESNKNHIWKDRLISFSSKPIIYSLNEEDSILERYMTVKKHDALNTDLYGSFETILNHCISGSVSNEDFPKSLVIFSDMEFDRLLPHGQKVETLYSSIKKLFENKGYDIPKIIFWNIGTSKNNFPVTKDENGTVMVGGFSPIVFSNIISIVKGEEVNPLDTMLEVISAWKKKVKTK